MTKKKPVPLSEPDLLAELAADLRPPGRLPGDVTVREVAKAAGISVETAGRRLMARVESGELVRQRVFDGGTRKWLNVWRRATTRPAAAARR